MNERDEDTKKAAQKARESLSRGFSDLFRAANTAASAVKNEAKKTFEPKKPAPSASANVGKAANDAGREVVRAAAEVATFLGTSLSSLGRRAEEAINGRVEPGGEAPAAEAAAGEEEWPKTREEYEKKYGRDGDEWPRSREEYEKKYGRPPRKRGDDDDPGFRIA